MLLRIKLGQAFNAFRKRFGVQFNFIAHGAFLIPTHALEQEDVDARPGEATAGFALLKELPAD